MQQLLGAHISIAGGLHKAIEKADELKFNAIQIFTKNNNRWDAKPLLDSDVDLFRTRRINSNVKFIVVHDSYLINLCSAKEEIMRKSISAFEEELLRCDKLGIEYLNFHPGAHGGQGEKAGLNLIVDSLNEAHANTQDINVSSMLELTAGQGTALGYKFEHIAKIIDGVKNKERMSVCIDTAHIFAAGYNLSDEVEYNNIITQFDKIIGLEYLKCFHINDSKKELGSKVDRHEHIGKGFIGLQGFRNIMNDERLAAIPKILETPKGKDYKEDLENIDTLKSLIT